MADSTSAAVSVASAPSSDDLQRAEEFTREPFVHEGETPEDALAPGTARRRALDAALAELDAGAEHPSVAWRRDVLAAARARAPARPRTSRTSPTAPLLSAHQVDALSGTLIALMAEAQRAAANGNGSGARRGRARRAGLRRPSPARRRSTRTRASPTRSRRTGTDEAPEDEDAPARRAARGPQRRAALLVRARDRRRQDRRRARLRRGLAHRRRPDPHPPPQPRRPVPRRAARPRLRQAHLARRCSTARTAANGPVTVETYQWFVRNAGKVSDAYTIVICDEAHTALGEKTRARRSAAGPARSSSA